MDRPRIRAALERAREDATNPRYEGLPRAPIARARRLAIGDPQAPLEKFLEILDVHHALGADGRLDPDVHLVSLGDHFDWGRPPDRARAARSGLELLSWLAAHPADHVTLIAGNHDLGRVCELVGHDQRGFRVIQSEADAAYRGGDPDGAAERAFLARHPELPTAEIAARDFATFRPKQRELVATLLRGRRFCAGVAASSSFLVCHAGVTSDDLAPLGLEPPDEADANAVANALNAALDAAVAEWSDGSPLSIPVLHQPGDAASGEGRGIFYHRPSHPDLEGPELFAGPPRRRFDPRRLPLGLTQAIGHIRDGKCRKLLGPWAERQDTVHGPLRHLRTDGSAVRYARSVPGRPEPATATLLFLDGGMADADPQAYELLDLKLQSPASRRP